MQAANGVIHVIDSVLIPSGALVRTLILRAFCSEAKTRSRAGTGWRGVIVRAAGSPT